MKRKHMAWHGATLCIVIESNMPLTYFVATISKLAEMLWKDFNVNRESRRLLWVDDSMLQAWMNLIPSIKEK